MKKPIRWNEEKNQLLQLQRGVGFEIVIEKLKNGDILGRKSHPNKDQYPNQFVFIMLIDNYIYYIPFVENDDEIFLKTIIPSRKLNKEYRSAANEK